MTLKAIGIAIISSAIAACSTSGVNQKDKNVTISISYGTIESTESVNLESKAGRSAAIGGLWGLLGNSGGNSSDMVGGALVGALLLGGTTKIAEGSREAEAYQVKLKDGSIVKVIIDNKELAVGDCVALEQGETTNLREVAPDLCEESIAGSEDLEIAAEMKEDAERCHVAKQQLLEAPTEAEVDSALKKVNVLCH